MSEQNDEDFSDKLSDVLGDLGEEMKNSPLVQFEELDGPVELNGIDLQNAHLFPSRVDVGDPVAVRGLDDEETKLGIFLGEFPTPISGESLGMYNTETGEVVVSFSKNPAIFVIEDQEVLRGYESWWTPVEDVEDMPEITDESIQNAPYIQLLNKMSDDK